MKIVEWSPDDLPDDLDLMDDGYWTFEDSNLLYDLEVGDMIQVLSHHAQGTHLLFVIDVWTHTDFDGEPTIWKSVIIDEDRYVDA